MGVSCCCNTDRIDFFIRNSLSLISYLTMEVTRKLVLLLNSDPKSLCVPLVGV